MHRLRNNGLTLVLLAVFVVTLAGQFLTGEQVYNEERQQRGLPPVTLASYIAYGHFWQATGENWESEFLQMSMFVVLTCFLYQKGSPESLDPDDPGDARGTPPQQSNDPRAPWPVRKGGWILWLYARSLSLCFLLLFALSVAMHAIGGARLYNEEQQSKGEPTVSAIGYMGTTQFWFESFQNWQSEFLSLAAMVYLAVYLRQHGSAESKPVATPHDEQGD